MQYAGSAWDELKHIRQAIGFLVSPHPSIMFKSSLKNFFNWTTGK